jgi:hypothetical protein
MRLRRGETVPALSPTDSRVWCPWFFGVIICAVLAGSRLRLHSTFAVLRSGCRSTAGAQIITVGADRVAN